MQPSPQVADRVFFSVSGLWFVVLKFVGFSPTFFMRVIQEPLPAHQVVHGVLNSAWVALFLVQALLISSRRLRLHMTLGAAAVLLLALTIPVGIHEVLIKTAAGLKTVDEAGFNLLGLALVLAFALAGLANRTRPFVHKRLMLFATLMLTWRRRTALRSSLDWETSGPFARFLPSHPRSPSSSTTRCVGGESRPSVSPCSLWFGS